MKRTDAQTDPRPRTIVPALSTLLDAEAALAQAHEPGRPRIGIMEARARRNGAAADLAQMIREGTGHADVMTPPEFHMALTRAVATAGEQPASSMCPWVGIAQTDGRLEFGRLTIRTPTWGWAPGRLEFGTISRVEVTALTPLDFPELYARYVLASAEALFTLPLELRPFRTCQNCDRDTQERDAAGHPHCGVCQPQAVVA